jgi:glycosyltransferase involved in cell wall biosynthesis
VRILYVSSQIFKKSSSASIRNNSLLKGLIDKEYSIDVLTIDYPEEYQEPYFKKNMSSQIKVYTNENIFLNKYLKRTVNRQSLNQEKNIMRSFIYSAKNQIKKQVKNTYFFPDMDKEWIKKYNKKVLHNDYDIVISSSDTKTSHFVAMDIKRKMNKNIVWFQIWGDPWREDTNLLSSHKSRANKWEKSFLRQADAIFYVSEPTINLMRKKYENFQEKMHFLPRTFLKEVINENLNESEKIVFLYTGIISGNRNIMNLINIIEKMNENSSKNIELRICGYCADEIKVKLSAYYFITFLNILPYEAVLKEYSNANYLVFLDNGKNSTQIPGKLFDYFGTNVPIVAIVETLNSPVAQFIEKTKRCILIENNELHKNFEDKLDQSNRNVLDQYSSKAAAEKIMKIINLHFHTNDIKRE